MNTLLEILLIIIIGWVFLPLVLGIPIVYFKLRFNVRHRISIPEEKELPGGCKAYFEQQRIALESLGFLPVRMFRHDATGVDGQVIFTYVFQNSTTNDTATIVYFLEKHITAAYIEFSRLFKNDFEVHTYNPPSDIFSYPDAMCMRKVHMKDTCAIFTDHCGYINSRHQTLYSIPFKIDQYSAYQETKIRMVYEFQALKGWMHTPDTGISYKMTFLGACYFVFREWITLRHLKAAFSKSA